MSVDIEVQLRTLGAHWDDAVAPVAFEEVVGTAVIDPAQIKTLAHRRDRTRWVFAGAAAALVAVAVVATLDRDDHSTARPEYDTTLTEMFVGEWNATESDGGTLTMTIVDTGDGSAEMTVHDTVASVCSGARSTMNGTGQVDSQGNLAIAAPVLTCDDGSQPEALSGPPLDEQLRNLTFTPGPNSTLADSLGTTWHRADAEPAPTASGGMWPQSTIEEVRAAQVLADAGDPAYTWQVDSELASEEGWLHLNDPGAEITERFLREELGWDEFVFDEFRAIYGEFDTSGTDGFLRGVTFLRCAPGEANPLYPDSADQPRGAQCAPTIDELRYETVSVDISQPDRVGEDGIWVVSAWRITEPFTQADPRALEAKATADLKNFLQARIDGEGAEGYLLYTAVPLLYATSAGANYERFEVARVSEPLWPYGDMDFTVRLFADGGKTVVEQPIWYGVEGSVESGGLPPRLTYSYWLTPWETTENGKPVAVPYQLFSGTITASAAAPWLQSAHFDDAFAKDDAALERVALTGADSVQISCQSIAAATDAAELAANIQSDPDLVVTAPVHVTVAGLDGLQMDVALAPGASACPEGRKGSEPNPSDRIRGTGFPLEQGSRMRLYLMDMPEGSATRILAVAIVAPDERFDATLVAVTPIVESIELLAMLDLAVGEFMPVGLLDFLTGVLEMTVEDANELSGSFDLGTVEPMITGQRHLWSEDAEISVYLARRTDAGGLIGADQWPVGKPVWIVDVTHAGLPRGIGLGLVDRIVIVYDAETGVELSYSESAPE